MIIAILLAVPGAAAGPDDGAAVVRALEQRLETAIERTLPSIVSVERLPILIDEDDSEERAAGGEPRDDDAKARRRPERRVHRSWETPHTVGTGVAIKRGLVLTNYHLVVPLSSSVRYRLGVWLPGGRRVSAELLAADQRSDLAVLKLPEAVMRPMQLAEPKPLRRGSILLVLTRPDGLAGDGQATATWAMVSNVRQRPSQDEETGRSAANTVHFLGTLVQLDSRLCDVGSGAAVVDLDGRLVGLTTALEALAGFEGQGTFAIPLFDRLRWIVDKLADGAPVEYGFLGVQNAGRVLRMPAPLGQAGLLDGARVGSVLPGSPAWYAGLRNGDVIAAVDGVRVGSFMTLRERIGVMPQGRACRLELRRAGRRHTTTVVLGKYPGVGRQIHAKQRSSRGMTLDWATMAMGGRTGGPALDRWPDFEALAARRPQVVVIDCAEDSPAFTAGVRSGHVIFSVNGVRAESPDQCCGLLRDATDGVRIETDERIINVPAE